MKKNLVTSISAIALLTAMAFPLQLAAQHTRYKLIDLGTFGGPASYFLNGFDGILNNQGTAVGWADTSMSDPFPLFCFNPDCFASHAFQWRNGAPKDLGTLPGGVNSQAFWISPNGLIAGNSENGKPDPLIPGFREVHAVLWNKGKITDLGTLEGGHESLVSSVNSRGQVVGLATNTVPDPFGFFGIQTRAFLWENGVMQDLGTLGDGLDANASFVNEAGQVTGFSFTSATANPITKIPTQDPFLWENGNMLDLGTLGGTMGMPFAFNNRGDVVGTSNLVGDRTFHPFLWTKNGGMQDLGTLGGDTGFTNWINDAGDIVGKADLPGPSLQNHDAVLWRHGTMIDLGTLPGDSCSNAYYVNSRGQVVGTSESSDLCRIPTGEHAFLWEKGGPMIDLNTLIPPNSPLELTFAVAINDRGEIAGFGVPADSDCRPEEVDLCGHAYMLIPCNGQDAHGESCQEKAESAAPISEAVSNQVAPTAALPHRLRSARSLLDAFRSNRFPGEHPAPHPDGNPGRELLHEPALFTPTPTLACLPYGSECRPGYHCCPGLVCVAASTRAYCL